MRDVKLDNELLLQLVESAQDGITVAEKEGNDTILLYANAAFEELTGYSLDDILYQDCRFLQGEETNQPEIKLIRQSIIENEPTRTILKNYRKDGKLFWNELSITPFVNSNDGITYYIGIQKDVTEQVELKQKLQAAQNRIAELEAQLAQLNPTAEPA